MTKCTPDTLPKLASGPTPLDYRLMRRREVTDTGCWNYLGTKNNKGYGQTTVGSLLDGSRKVRKVHILAYELWVGAVPDGLELDHLCRNPSCFNPEHLEAVTHLVNMRRRVIKSLGRTECSKGHRYTPESSWVTAEGYTKCKTCNRERRARQRAAAKTTN